MDVDAIADELGHHILLLGAGRNGARIPVVKGVHGVVKMGQVGGSGLNAGFGLVIIGVGVGNGNHAVLGGLTDKRFGAG